MANPLARPTKEGWLFKEGGGARNKWQSRWFVLRSYNLCYYLKKDDPNVLGSINLMEVDDISKIGEHSGKPYCLTIVGAKAGSKKVYYLAAEGGESLNDWFSALKAASFIDVKTRFTKFVTVEVFLGEGIRINGDVCYQILSSLSMRSAPEKKRRDHLGWFCEREVPVATVLNLFASFGWEPEKIYRSSGLSPINNGIQPIIRIIFTKPPDFVSGKNPAITRKGFGESIREHFGRGKQFESAAGSCDPQHLYTTADLGPNLLEGTDDELIKLMQEFDIPLSLLQVHSE